MFIIAEMLLEGGGRGVSHPVSLKFQGQLSIIPKIIKTVLSPKLLILEFDK